jgi:hypothetical protein
MLVVGCILRHESPFIKRLSVKKGGALAISELTGGAVHSRGKTAPSRKTEFPSLIYYQARGYPKKYLLSSYTVASTGADLIFFFNLERGHDEIPY